MSKLQAVDPLLIRKLRTGDERAFHMIYTQLHERIYHFTLTFLKDTELSKEITQEVFLHLWLNKEKLLEELPLYPFLFTKARQLIIDAFRKSTVIKRVMEQLFDSENLFQTNNTEDKVLWNDLNRITADILSHLPLQQQKVFRMSRIDGLSYEEIAKELSISKNTVKYHLVCALKSVREHLLKYDMLYNLPISFFFFIFFNG